MKKIIKLSINFQDGAVVKARHKGAEVDVKTIQVEDGELAEDRVKVSLWRDAASRITKPGDFVQISHVYAQHNTFYNELILASTQHTHVKVCRCTYPKLIEVLKKCLHLNH